jgi:hypothetical protein
MVYRSLISMPEDDQLFLDPAQTVMEAEQKAIQQKLDHLRPYTTGLGVASAALGAGLLGTWLYQSGGTV